MLGKRVFTVLAALSLSCAFVACDDEKAKDEVDIDEAMTAAKADLTSCDFSKASTAYETIYASASKASGEMTAEIAVNRSVLGAINLLNNEKLKPILTKFGFEADQTDFSYLWNDSKDGVFAIMQSSEKDYSVLEGRFKHPANGDKDFLDVLDKSFTLGDVVKVLVSMESEFDSLAASFEEAAKLVEDGKVIAVGDAGCGLNKLQFSNADLYAFAAALRAASSAVELAKAYDLNMTVYDLIKYMDYEWAACHYGTCTEEECKNECDTWKRYGEPIIKMLSTVVDKSPNGRVALVDAVRLASTAISLAPKANDSSFFGWSTFKAGSLSDVKTILDGVSDNKVVLSAALFSKEMSFDLNKIFDTPTKFDESKLKLVCEISPNYDQTGYWIDGASLEWDEALSDYVNKIAGATIFDIDEEGYSYIVEDYSMDYSSAWDEFDVEYFLDPHKCFTSEDEEQW